MKTFTEWLMENSLSTILKVPQNPKHHSEGDAKRHSLMVRSSLDSAIKLLQSKQAEDPNGPFSTLNLQFTPEEYNILRLAGLLHDIGKGVTTDPEKLTAYGHENPSNFEKAMKMLGPQWQKMYANANQQDKDDLWYIITHHMNLDDTSGFASKSLKLDLLDQDGKYKADRRVKLLLVLLLMDRLGRGGDPNFNLNQARQFAVNNLDAGREGMTGMYASSQWAKERIAKINAHQNKPASPSNPQDFVVAMAQSGKTPSVIKQAMKGKFPQLSDGEISMLVGENVSFKKFYEAEEAKPATMKADIPLPEAVYQLSQVFKHNGFLLYVVGGAVRDFLIHQQDGEKGQYKPKDVDLATDAPPREVERILNAAGIRNFEKGESFGVWVAHIDGEDFEIATFREDGGYSDGRRPDSVKWASPETDYKRRDLTMNALFYDIASGQIIDHGKGQGFDDLKNKRVRVVGDPFDRFGEDKLRVPRMVRFYSRFNDGDVRGTLDDKTIAAVDQFKDLRSHGVTGPRIQAEFLAGLQKSKDPRSYLRNYETLGLLPAVFPGLTLDMDSVEKLEGPVGRNPVVALALLFRKNGNPDKVRSTLNKLDWPNDITDEVAFLLKSWQVGQNPTPETMSRHALDMAKKPTRRDSYALFGNLVGPEVNQDHWSHLSGYQAPNYSGDFIQQNYGIAPGPEMGKKQRELATQHYDQSFRNRKV